METCRRQGWDNMNIYTTWWSPNQVVFVPKLNQNMTDLYLNLTIVCVAKLNQGNQAFAHRPQTLKERLCALATDTKGNLGHLDETQRDEKSIVHYGNFIEW